MEITELFKGIAIVIDNEINDEKANIANILCQIKNKNIPYLGYQALPPDEVVSNFQNLSFVLLDWDLGTDPITAEDVKEGVRIPDAVKEAEIQKNIQFIKKLKSICYCPVFVFSDLDVSTITSKLVENKLYAEDKPNHILIKAKSDLKGRSKLFNEIERWVMRNPSTYVLKEWENEYQKSKNTMFVEFQNLSAVWPKIMWNTYGKDGVNKSRELSELISQNLLTRVAPFEYSDEILSKRGKKIDKSDVNIVLEGASFLKNLHNDNIAPGDVFKIKSEYYMNIRASCDLFPEGRNSNTCFDDVLLYLIKGGKITTNQTQKKFSKKYGHFSEIDNQAIVFPMANGEAIDFRFKNLYIWKWSKVRDNRIGRILPPYITRIQQKYAQYLQRQGLARTPCESIYSR